jgi:hypothetical protein
MTPPVEPTATVTVTPASPEQPEMSRAAEKIVAEKKRCTRVLCVAPPKPKFAVGNIRACCLLLEIIQKCHLSLALLLVLHFVRVYFSAAPREQSLLQH